MQHRSIQVSEPRPEASTAELIATLHELIDALDSRVPHVERAGEAQIARDAAALRQQAVNRIAELSGGV
jgi:hypothetical protein